MFEILYAVIPIILISILIVILKSKSGAGTPKLIVGGTVAIILVAIALVPALDLFEDTDADTIYFDDYFQTDAVDSSGALELVQIGSQTYAHAASVGEGTLTYADDTTVSHDVKRANLDVFLFMGQSNIAYWEGKYINGQYERHAIPSVVTPQPTPGHTYYYGSDNSPYTPDLNELSTLSIHDMVDLDTGLNKIGSLDAPFATNYYDATGHKCLVINCGWSGQSISSFVQGGSVYNHAKIGYNDAISKIDDNFIVSVKGYIFCQGEADTLMPIEEYKSKFTAMNMLLTEGSFSTTHLPHCYIDLVREYWAGNAYTAQLELASSLKSVEIASTISETFSIAGGTLMSDNLHYTQIGQNRIAAELIDTITD